MTLVLQNIHTLVTQVEGRPPLHNVDVVIEGNRITALHPGPVKPLPPPGAEVIEASRHVVYPGFVNTHHHLYQTLTRNIPSVQNAKLFDWLVGLYEIWRGLTPDAVDTSTRVGVGELLLSGCTTTTDHFYVFPRGQTAELLDVEIAAAREMGIRFHPTRGSMSRGRSQGGLPPDDVVQHHEDILRDCARVIDAYHDPAPDAMCRIALAPCSPFSVTTDLLAETIRFARDRGVICHTHLCETVDEEDYCLATHGLRPLEYMEKTGWLGPDVWFAHGIYFNEGEIARLAATRTGIAHCPTSNLRLGSGIAPVPAMLKAGVRVGLAVDGSASNDSSSLSRELQMALLVHRVGTAVDAMPAPTVVRMATRGGADLLGWPDAGWIGPGALADLALFRLDRIEYAGAMTDPAAAILYCGAGARADYTIVNGIIRVAKGELLGVDEQRLFHHANDVTANLLKKAGITG
ncbi:MAG TPA: 8-oxoguanine deaminase [Kiritimatiellia bacterium]|nr:8-oxoguanine deaminase [Kiritimatiellia bacterium]HMP35667.1 8-oxoguanine deaminase [Kiritimatiellia bacterium]